MPQKTHARRGAGRPRQQVRRVPLPDRCSAPGRLVGGVLSPQFHAQVLALTFLTSNHLLPGASYNLRHPRPPAPVPHDLAFPPFSRSGTGCGGLLLCARMFGTILNVSAIILGLATNPAAVAAAGAADLRLCSDSNACCFELSTLSNGILNSLPADWDLRLNP